MSHFCLNCKSILTSLLGNKEVPKKKFPLKCWQFHVFNLVEKWSKILQFAMIWFILFLFMLVANTILPSAILKRTHLKKTTIFVFRILSFRLLFFFKKKNPQEVSWLIFLSLMAKSQEWKFRTFRKSVRRCRQCFRTDTEIRLAWFLLVSLKKQNNAQWFERFMLIRKKMHHFTLMSIGLLFLMAGWWFFIVLIRSSSCRETLKN